MLQKPFHGIGKKKNATESVERAVQLFLLLKPFNESFTAQYQVDV